MCVCLNYFCTFQLKLSCENEGKPKATRKKPKDTASDEFEPARKKQVSESFPVKPKKISTATRNHHLSQEQD